MGLFQILQIFCRKTLNRQLRISLREGEVPSFLKARVHFSRNCGIPTLELQLLRKKVMGEELDHEAFPCDLFEVSGRFSRSQL